MPEKLNFPFLSSPVKYNIAGFLYTHTHPTLTIIHSLIHIGSHGLNVVFIGTNIVYYTFILHSISQ